MMEMNNSHLYFLKSHINKCIMLISCMKAFNTYIWKITVVAHANGKHSKVFLSILFNLRNLYDRASVNTCLKPHSSELFSVMRRGCLAEMPVRLNLENSSVSTGSHIVHQDHGCSQPVESSCWLLQFQGGMKRNRGSQLPLHFYESWEFYIVLHFHLCCVS